MSRQYENRGLGISQGQKREPPFSGGSNSDYNPMSGFSHQGGYQPQGMPPSETLLSQYKKCTLANNEALRNARNLEEVVSIKVKAIDSKLGAQGMPFESQMHEGQFPDANNQGGQQNYDFKFDPIHFRQKVPCMADRGFLINQAILSSSNQTKNLAFQGQIMQGRGTTAGTQKYGTLGSIGGSLTSPNMSNDPRANQGKYVTGTDAEGRLFSGDRTTNQGDFEEMNNAFDNKTEAADHTQADSQQEGEPVDPINQLKSIFKPKNKTKRPKLELNPIMNKYKQKNHSSSQQFRSSRGTARANRNFGGINTYNGGKQFKEDMFGVPGGHSNDYHSQMQNYNQLPEIHSTQNQPISRGMQDQGSMRSSHQDTKSIKDRLEDLRKLFAEEDINETVKGIQHDWELEDQKISVQKGRQASTGMATKGPQGAQQTNAAQDVNDLRGYLTQKIQQVQDRSHPDQLHREVFSGIKGIGEQVPDCNYKFKASTLTHIAELKKFGQEKIENHFIERLFKQQTDYHYEQFEYNRQKEVSRQATMGKSFQQKNAPTNLVQSDMFAQEQGTASRQRFRTKNKPKNYVQEQLLKIERMNKESEKMNKQYQQQVKNEEIFDIIEDTQMQMTNQQYMQPTNFADIQINQNQQNIPGAQYTKSPKRSQSQQRKQKQEEQEPKLDPELLGLLGTRVFDTSRVNQIQEKTQLPHGIQHTTKTASPTHENQLKTNETTNVDSPSKDNNKSPDVQNITSKVNVASTGYQPGDEELKQRNHQFRVSKMVQDYNIKDQAMNPYLSDSEIYAKPNSRQMVRAIVHPESRGGGFKDTRPKWKEVGTKTNALTTKGDQSYKIKMLRSPDEQAVIEEDIFDKDITNGNSFSYFCPKRFNRYPRFTIFFKKEHANMSDQYQAENTVSLSPQFLSYLMDKNSVMRNPIIQQSTKAAQGQSIDFDKGTPQDSREIGNNYEKLQERTANTANSNALPEETVIGWNQNKGKEAVQNYDPFEKVVLVKGIDNSILTSFRTLKRENNTVSDTFKIVHQKFLPVKGKGLYYKQFQKNQGDKMTLYPHSDNEDALEFAHAELLAESLLHQGEDAKNDDSQMMNINQIDSSNKQNISVKGPGIRPNLDQVAQDALNNGGISQITSAVRQSGAEQLSVIQSENISQQINQISPRQAIKSTTGGQGSKINSQGFVQDRNIKMAALSSKDHLKKEINNEVSDVSLVGQKLQPNLGKKQIDTQGKIYKQPQVTQQPPSSQYQARKLASSPLRGNDGSESARNQDGNQFKHQIEVMVLSKVDPLAGSQFPGRGIQQSETNLSGSVTQKGNTTGYDQKQNISQAQMYQSKRNPFKGGQPSSPNIIQPQTMYTQGLSPKMSQSRTKLPGLQKHQKKKTKNAQLVTEGQDSQEPSKYGKDFKIPELPHLLQEQFFGTEFEVPQKPGNPPTQFETANNQYKIKKFIDDIYQKEMKYRYHKQYVREDFLLTQSPIFDLQKFHYLRPQGDLLRKGKGGAVNTSKAIGLDKHGKPVMHHESQSLTNVLGFQAGGPHVVVPVQPKQIYQFQNQIQSGANLDGGLKGMQPINMAAQIEGIYNAGQIQFGALQGPGDQHFNDGNVNQEGSAEDVERNNLVGSALGNLKTSHKIISEKSESNPGPVTQATVSKVNN